MGHPIWLRTTLALALAFGAPDGAAACRLALVLAMDVSKSVDGRDYRLQFGGLAAALRDPDVRATILEPDEPVAITVFEWSDATHHEVIADWTLAETGADLDGIAARLDRHERTGRGRRTAVGSALEFAHAELARMPDCARQTIDLSSDGYNNRGPEPEAVYLVRDFDSTTVNALVIGGRARPELMRYYETRVIRGVGAFAIPTWDFSDYKTAIREKLLRELAPAAVVASAPTD
ncbi:DUF1194 domain-containing protein [Defluviimonas sp. WL0024]|uniref:DUF1194 domain-containing protein n=2 Tax=Albidovulum TaxID=205889 RepID=A0ABT3J647_9RHOB|nr:MULTISPECIES: DUF1194 domain-containing protein [Defluviimonas]MCU9849903.1 DUF1194 domain-containing protein [Defluviimonas sp. WL0024]MCW3783146.1 DUF1194 domain-containing protein [Defluviimonas salinarum]